MMKVFMRTGLIVSGGFVLGFAACYSLLVIPSPDAQPEHFFPSVSPVEDAIPAGYRSEDQAELRDSRPRELDRETVQRQDLERRQRDLERKPILIHPTFPPKLAEPSGKSLPTE